MKQSAKPHYNHLLNNCNNVNKVSGTREWASLNYNFINGCSHDCKYCYAKANAMRFKRKNRESWKEEDIQHEKMYPKVKPKGNYTMFPSSHDISPSNLNSALIVLEELLKNGHRVMIVTKAHLDVVQAICSNFTLYKDKILFRVTIGSMNSDTLKFWEPGAPSYEERSSALKHAFYEGFQTSVSCEPALDTNCIELAEKVLPFITDAFWIGKANRLKGIITLNCGNDPVSQRAVVELEMSQSDEWVNGLYQHFRNNPKVKWKDSIKKIIGIASPTLLGLDI